MEGSPSLPLLPAIALTLVQVFGITGNVLVIHAVYTRKRFHTNYYLLVHHLAIADLVFLLSASNVTLFHWFPSFKLLYWTATCKVASAVETLFYTAGVGFLLFIGFLRYRRMFYPHAQPVTGKKLKLAICIVYVASLVIALPQSIFLIFNKDGVCVILKCNRLANIIMNAFLLFFNLVVPVVFLLVVYAKIIHGLWLQQRHFRNLIGQGVVASNQARPINAQLRARQRRFAHASLVSFAIVVLFCFSSAPFEILWFMAALRRSEYARIPSWVLPIKVFGTSAVNPLIYGVADGHLRQSFKRTLRKLAKCCQL